MQKICRKRDLTLELILERKSNNTTIFFGIKLKTASPSAQNRHGWHGIWEVLRPRDKSWRRSRQSSTWTFLSCLAMPRASLHWACQAWRLQMRRGLPAAHVEVEEVEEVEDSGECWPFYAFKTFQWRMLAFLTFSGYCAFPSWATASQLQVGLNVAVAETLADALCATAQLFASEDEESSPKDPNGERVVEVIGEVIRGKQRKQAVQ